jgi:hypothetical protein
MVNKAAACGIFGQQELQEQMNLAITLFFGVLQSR